MIIHHHLGLGDHFVCNGLVNYISFDSSEPIDLICKKYNLETIQYLYSENTKVNVIPIESINEIAEVNNYANITKQKLLRVGFEHCDPQNWDRSFYKQLNIDFIERYRSFRLPTKKPKQLIQIPSSEYILIHNESSDSKYDLNINTYLDKYFIVRKNEYHLLSYIDVILNAQEIHCIDSSVFHLIDSISNITNKLYYHNIRKNSTCFNKSLKWKIISYDN